MRVATGPSCPERPATEMIDFRKGRMSVIWLDPKDFMKEIFVKETFGFLYGNGVAVGVGVFDGV